MNTAAFTRRKLLAGSGAALAALGVSPAFAAQVTSAVNAPAGRPPQPIPPTADQVRRMQWWHAAKFGMFIHFGLYSQHARHEWAMENEAIPVGEYMQLAKV